MDPIESVQFRSPGFWSGLWNGPDSKKKSAKIQEACIFRFHLRSGSIHEKDQQHWKKTLENEIKEMEWNDTYKIIVHRVNQIEKDKEICKNLPMDNKWHISVKNKIK